MNTPCPNGSHDFFNIRTASVPLGENRIRFLIEDYVCVKCEQKETTCTKPTHTTLPESKRGMTPNGLIRDCRNKITQDLANAVLNGDWAWEYVGSKRCIKGSELLDRIQWRLDGNRPFTHREASNYLQGLAEQLSVGYGLHDSARRLRECAELLAKPPND